MPVAMARLRPIAAGLLVAAIACSACDATRPSASPGASGSIARPSASLGVDASMVPFEPVTYPAAAEAPCGEVGSPDAAHGPYTGNLRRISAPDAATVIFELCDPDVAFPARLASPSFAIQDSGWLDATIDPAKDGEQAIVRDVNGTGPFMLQAWNRGSDVTLARFDGYRDGPASPERIIFRWTETSHQRLAELQARTVDGIDDLDPTDADVAAGNVDLTRLDREGLNLLYLGFNDQFAPFDSAQVRQAIAMGIDRKAIVDKFFPAGSTVATHAAPCALTYGCSGAAMPAFDPTKAKEVLAAAGFGDGFKTTLRYSDVAREYFPDPTAIATEIQAQLKDNLGIDAALEVEEFDQFVDDVDGGKLDGIHLLGARSRYPDVSGFLDPLFGSTASDEFGAKDEGVTNALAKGAGTTDAKKREKAYAAANDLLAKRVPMVPIAHAGSVVAYQADVTGSYASPLGIERFSGMDAPDRRQLVWMQATEPTGLYCADQVAVDALRICAQIGESLYGYGPDGAVVPSLAESCTADDGLISWTCKLRTGVDFHDGAALDAGDVVDTFAVQWDAEHPRHRGGDGAFQTFSSLFGGFLNPSPATP
jgi:ABC-type transport system substrate-binding protein